MKAAAVRPGQVDSLHLRDMPRPSLDEVPGGRGVRIRVLQVGLCATDRELAEGLYGSPPPGADHLVIGHESLGQVTEVGPAAAAELRPGQLVVPTIRRAGSSLYDRAGRQDLSTDEALIERGISLRHGYLAEEVVESSTELIRVPDALAGVAVLSEPMACVRKGLRQADAIGARLRLWEPRRALVLGAGPIGLLAALELRLRGHAVTCYARTQAPYLNSELVERIGARYLSAADADLETASAEHGPFDLVVEATGAPALVFPATRALAPNGILLLLSITAGSRPVEVDAARFNQSLVLRNRVLVGSVAAAHEDFAAAVELFTRAEAAPDMKGWLASLITTRIEGFDLPAIESELQDGSGIKAVVEVASPSG
ncbi:glucose 1-dehydrogenase [soil metagenome]